MSKLIKGMVAGAAIGTAISMAVLPQLDRKTQRTVKRAGRKLINAAGDTVENMMSMMK